MFAGAGEGVSSLARPCPFFPVDHSLGPGDPRVTDHQKKVHCLREGAQETLGGDAWSGGYDEREGVPAKTPALLSWPIQRDFQES